MFVYAADHLSI